MDELVSRTPTGTSAARPLPRWLQVKRQLADLLHEGRWQHGRPIASEPLLARRFGVSIGTVRRAVEELVAEGVLVREQGRGTFVRSHTRDTMLEAFFHLVDADGRKELPRAELLSLERRRADRTTAARLAIAPGAPVLRLRHRLVLDGRPTVHDDIRLPAARFPGLREVDLSERETTLYGLLQQRFGVTVVRVVEHLEAVAADGEVAGQLGVPAGAPLLRIVRTAYSHGGEPAETRVRHVLTGARRYERVIGRR